MTREKIGELVAKMNELHSKRKSVQFGNFAMQKKDIKNELLEAGVLVGWNDLKKEYEAHEIIGYYIDNDMEHGKEVNCSLEEAKEIAKSYIAYGRKGVRIFDKTGYVCTAIEHKKTEEVKK